MVRPEVARTKIARAAALRRATGLRNRIAHGYGRVEHRRIYDEAPEGLAALRRFLDALSRRLPV